MQFRRWLWIPASTTCKFMTYMYLISYYLPSIIFWFVYLHIYPLFSLYFNFQSFFAFFIHLTSAWICAFRLLHLRFSYINFQNLRFSVTPMIVGLGNFAFHRCSTIEFWTLLRWKIETLQWKVHQFGSGFWHWIPLTAQVPTNTVAVVSSRYPIFGSISRPPKWEDGQKWFEKIVLHLC